MKEITLSDYLALFYSKFKVDIPHENKNFNIINFVDSFERFIKQVIIPECFISSNDILKELEKNKFLYFYIDKEENESYNCIFEYKKNKKIYLSSTINLFKENIKVVDFYDSKLYKISFFKAPKDLLLSNFINFNLFEKDVALKFEKSKICLEEHTERKLSVIVENKEYLISEIKSDDLNFSKWIEYFYEDRYDNFFEMVDISFYNVKDYSIISLNYDIYKNKYYLKNNKTDQSLFKNLSLGAVNYLNNINKKVKDINDEDFKLISLIEY